MSQHPRSRAGAARAFAGGLVLLLALGACSDSSAELTGDEKQAAEALSASFQKGQNPTSGFVANAGQADCIAESLVGELGVDSLVDYGFLTDELEADLSSTRTDVPADDAGTMADIFMACADLASLIKDDLGYDQMTEAVQGCVDDALTDDALHDLLVASFTGDSSAAQEMQTTITACTLAG